LQLNAIAANRKRLARYRTDKLDVSPACQRREEVD
jgi:hypothetical protein